MLSPKSTYPFLPNVPGTDVSIPPPPVLFPISSAHTTSHWSSCLGIPFHFAVWHRSTLPYVTISVEFLDLPPSTRLSQGSIPAELNSFLRSNTVCVHGYFWMIWKLSFARRTISCKLVSSFHETSLTYSC